MSERKPCIRCERVIDASANLCPYCNWNQSMTPPVRETVPIQVAEYKPPEELDLKKYGWYGLVGALMLIVAFGFGMLINSDGVPEHVPEPVVQENVPAPKRADTPLIPVAEGGGIEQPITSAPASGPVPGGNANQYDRTDATAVSASEYAQIAKRAQAEKKKMTVLVDPRTLTGPAYAQGVRRSTPGTVSPLPGGQPLPQSPADVTQARPVERRSIMRTRAVPRYQPIPQLRARGTGLFDLTVGADGRVKDINVRRSVDGNTAALISAMQSWRFKPATENGEPVASSFTVEISFGRR